MTQSLGECAMYTASNHAALQVAAGFVLHVGQVRGVLKVGDAVTAQLEARRRDRIMSNHTMTHVLNFGLREVPAACPPSAPNRSCLLHFTLEPVVLQGEEERYLRSARLLGVSTSTCARTPLHA